MPDQSGAAGKVKPKPKPKPKPKTKSKPKSPWDHWTAAENRAIDAAVGAADPREVTKAFIRIMPNFSGAEWLKSSHRLWNGTSGSGRAPHNQSTTASIAEYSAAAVPLHVADAWSYLGRAMAAISVGSADVARHLLYYCELRAMYALLARHGIVLMNRSNFVITAAGTTSIPIPDAGVAGNEHQAVWVLFRHWVSSGGAARFLEGTIRQRGEELDRWVAERPVPATLDSVLVDSLKQWGMDVARFSHDRELRNEASYRPTRLRMTPSAVTPEYVTDLYTDVWDLLDPEPSNPFENLDRAIMRGMFATLAARDRGSRVARLPSQYRNQYEYWVDKVVGLDGAQSLADYFATPTVPQIIVDAGRDPATVGPADELSGMLGRTLILLRFATGASRQLLSEAGCTASDVEFWLTDLLTTHGIRTPDGSPPDYQDLHAAVAEVVADIGILSGETDPVDLALITEELAEQFQILSSFERVPAWAAAPPAPRGREAVA